MKVDKNNHQVLIPQQRQISATWLMLIQYDHHTPYLLFRSQREDPRHQLLLERIKDQKSTNNHHVPISQNQKYPTLFRLILDDQKNIL
jgi:hypothetical protein